METTRGGCWGECSEIVDELERELGADTPATLFAYQTFRIDLFKRGFFSKMVVRDMFSTGLFSMIVMIETFQGSLT